MLTLASTHTHTHTHTHTQESDRAAIQNNIDATNLHKAPIFSIGGYSVLELLGSGAFGSVYKVMSEP